MTAAKRSLSDAQKQSVPKAKSALAKKVVRQKSAAAGESAESHETPIDLAAAKPKKTGWLGHLGWPV